MGIRQNSPRQRAAEIAQRTKGRFYSYREEEPQADLLLKVVPYLQHESGVPHSHDFAELVYVSSGSGVHCMGGERTQAYAGDCFMVPPFTRHNFECNRQFAVVNVIFYPEICRRFARELSALDGFRRFFVLKPVARDTHGKLHLDISQRKRLGELLAMLRDELDQERTGRRVAAEGLFFALVVQVSRWCETNVSADRVQPAGLGGVAERAVAYLEEHHETQVRVSEIAHHLGISPSRLEHVFKDATGTSLIDYLMRLRVDRACGMLRQGQRALTDIALSVGFRDPSYFTRRFHSLTGTTPSAYRKAIVTGMRGG